MSGKDRIVIALALLLMALSLAGAGALMPDINAQRVDLQLVANEDVAKNMPPDIAIIQAVLGSFRGIFVDMLWARAEAMKQDGKFWESGQLCRWITTLQPRFPQVWANRAWDQAYNISVATHTPEERWNWVQSGIRLLRDEGIPLNPSAAQLYKELSWIHLHKIGMFSDDLHRYYKQCLAKEWEELLGAPPPGDTQAVVDSFRPVAQMYQKYINRHERGGELAAEFDRLLADPDLKEPLTPLKPLGFERFVARLNRLYASIQSSDSLAAKRLAKLMELTEAQRTALKRDPLERLAEDDEEVRKSLAALARTGFKPDLQMLGALAALASREPPPGEKPEVAATINAAVARQLQSIGASPQALLALHDWANDPATAAPRARLLALLRARILDQTYHMDPLWMLELMDGRWLIPEDKPDKVPIPIDWRHPAAHGLYWASLGVRNLKGFVRAEDYDVLNTDRQVLHSLQSLMQSGKLIYHYNVVPQLADYEQVPDPRYIDPYHYAMFGATDRIANEKVGKNTTAITTFEAGHENFLIEATQIAFLYSNDPKQADKYYRRLRDLYTKKQVAEGRPDRYKKSIEDFVVDEFVHVEAGDSMEDAGAIVHGMLTRYITEGMIGGDWDRANRFFEIARTMHAMYQKKQNFESTNVTGATRNRMAMPAFETMLTDVMESFLMKPTFQAVEPVVLKSRAWRNAPAELQRRVFVRPGVQNALYKMCQTVSLNPQLMFPEPPGMEQYRKLYGQPLAPDKPAGPAAPDSLEGQLERK